MPVHLLRVQADALQELLPNLTPSFLPLNVSRDVLHLAELEGDAGSQALLEVTFTACHPIRQGKIPSKLSVECNLFALYNGNTTETLC